MEHQNNTIDLRQLFRVLNYYKMYVIVIAAIVTGIFSIYLYVNQGHTNVYEAKSQIYVEEKTVKDNAVSGASNHIINDYLQLIQSDFILEDVQHQLDEKYSTSQLRSKISVNAEENSNVINIIVKDSDPDMAKIIANEAAQLATDKIRNISEYYNAFVVGFASKPTSPISVGIGGKILKLFVLLLVLLSGIVLVIYLLKSNIKDKEALETGMDTEILGTIPKARDFENYNMGDDIFKKFYIRMRETCTLLMITSPHSGDGKSLISEGLAKEFANNKKKTLLLKLTDASEEENVIGTDKCGFDVLNLDRNGMLLQETFFKRIEELQKDYDIVFVDGANFDTVESYILMEVCSSVLIVLDPNNTNISTMLNMKHKFDKYNCTVQGMILNKVKY